MQNGKHGAVAGWIQELVGVPARGERSRLGLAIAHHATNEQVRIVECGAVSVSKGVSKFAAFVNGTRRLRRDVALGSSPKIELFEEPSHAVSGSGGVRVERA